MRNEKEIFNDLRDLCTSPGFAHVVALFCFRDNTIRYTDQVTPDDYARTYSKEKLIRTEISTLIGLMVKEEIDYSISNPSEIKTLFERTEGLLEELHQSMSEKAFGGLLSTEVEQEELAPPSLGVTLREPIFYSGESAYDFQYREFSLKKYAQDNDWLLENKGFTIAEAVTIISSIEKIQNRKLNDWIESIGDHGPQYPSVLPAYVFSVDEAVNESGIEESTINKFLRAFSIHKDEKNKDFNALNDFNITNACPIIGLDNQEYLLFQKYSLVESLYESPFYWILNDEDYFYNKGMHNRGVFAEEFSAERLELVFGKQRVFRNVKFINSKQEVVGEIDVLVLFANRAIVLQAKSKRLTIESRKGNENRIKTDFQMSIQDSYDQGFACSEMLSDINLKLIDSENIELTIPKKLKEIYILCVVSEHYPALSFQARQFLKYEASTCILPPFIMDVFLLDVMTEFLSSPLSFLSYINRRVLYSEKILATHELTVLALHLKENLWIEDDLDVLFLGDDIVSSLDVAMLVRRAGVPGNPVPEGILTRYMDTTVRKIITKIEELERASLIGLGFMLLTLSGSAIERINNGIDYITQLARSDKRNHDFTFASEGDRTGITIHSNYYTIVDVILSLKSHCERRKYKQKANKWFGLSINPDDLSFKFGIELDFEWAQSQEMDDKINNTPRLKEIKNSGSDVKPQKKIGRNDPCPCGSGKKYKKCCLNA